MQKGTIGVTTDNIFPIIKKFLYSDHEIFLREVVSNAVDATQKLKTLSSVGEFKGELGTLDVRVAIDKEAGTLVERIAKVESNEKWMANSLIKAQIEFVKNPSKNNILQPD